MEELLIEEKAKRYDKAFCDFAYIQDYEGLYKINKKGEVLSVRSGKLLKAGKNKQGYMNVVLSKNGESKVHKVHRLVARTFIPNPNNYPFINHKDEDKANNCVENLEWCTAKYNINYGTANKRRGTTSRLNPLKPRKPILQLSLSGEVVGEYNSTNEAFEKTGIDRRQISDAINHRKRQACGFFWVLKDDYDPNIDYPTKYKRYATRHRDQHGSLSPSARPIAQYSKDGIFIQSWGCIMDAKNALNINYSTIWRCLQGYRKLGKGYIWKYL